MMVRCKKCEDEHASMIQMDDSSFRSTDLQDNSEQCPRCRQASTYNKPDYFFRWH